MSSDNTKTGRNQIFISYSHKDGVWLERFQVMLKPVRRIKLQVWADTKIEPGENWREQIDEALNSARVALLLVTPDFLASDFIAENELPFFLEAVRQERIQLFWVAVSETLYKYTELVDLQAANNPAIPLDSLSPSDLNVKIAGICAKIIDAMDSPDTWQPPEVEATPDSFETASSLVSSSLLSATELLLRPQIKDHLMFFSWKLKHVQEKVETIIDYTALLDLLHDLEIICEGTGFEAEHLTDDAWEPMNLIQYRRDLRHTLNSLKEVAGRLPSTNFNLRLDDITRIYEEFGLAIDGSDKAGLERALWRLENLLNTVPIEIESRMGREIRSLSLPGLIDVLERVRQGLPEARVLSEEGQKLGDGINALNDLDRQLTALADEHDQWRDIKDYLRLVKDSLSLDQVKEGIWMVLWPRVKSKMEAFYEGHEQEEWAESMKGMAAKLDEALAGGDNIQAEKLFASYYQEATWRAVDISRSLIKTLSGLSKVGETLSFMTNAFDLSAR